MKRPYYSTIRMADRVANRARHPAANLTYVPVRVQQPDGIEVDALFTDHAISEAITRARIQPEDMPPRASIWHRVQHVLFGG